MKQLLTYRKDGGQVYVTYVLENETPAWNFRYKADSEHLNSNAIDHDKKVVLGPHSALIRPIHKWSFLFINPSNFPVEDIKVSMTWWQEVNGQPVQLHQWEEVLDRIKAVSGDELKSEILLNPS